MQGKKRLTKTAFVLGLDPTLSAAEVAQRAKEQGLTLTAAHVSVIRSVAKRKGVGSRKRAATADPPLAAPKRGSASAKSAEARLYEAAAQLGLERCRAILDQLSARMKKLAG
jgi:hypothetical protein